MIRALMASLCLSLVLPAMMFADVIVMIGYWPPTNEMLRPWSENASQNPGGWQGQNWGGHGHDVYSFFPEFPPDGNPFNDTFGSNGWVGSPDSDFRVDYQDTSLDFWRVMDELNPTSVITYSWGGSDNRWEIEAVEGGHSGGGADPSMDWASDGHGAEFLPDQTSIDPRSWDAISTYRNGQQLGTALPVDEIVTATSALGTANVFVDHTGTSGNYLSGFLGLHGLYHNSISDGLFAGHIHVGSALTVGQATDLTEATLTEVLLAMNRVSVPESGNFVILLLVAGAASIFRRRSAKPRPCSANRLQSPTNSLSW